MSDILQLQPNRAIPFRLTRGTFYGLQVAGRTVATEGGWLVVWKVTPDEGGAAPEFLVSDTAAPGSDASLCTDGRPLEARDVLYIGSRGTLSVATSGSGDTDTVLLELALSAPVPVRPPTDCEDPPARKVRR